MLTKKDIWQYHWYIWKPRALRRLIPFAAFCVLVPCLNFIPGYSSGVRNTLAPSAALGLVVLAIQTAVVMSTILFRCWKALKPGAVGLRVAEIGKFDFCWGEAKGSGYHRHWSDFDDIVSTKNAFYFMLTGTRALVIPKSAFTDSAQAVEFFALSLQRWEVAKANQRHAAMAGEGVWPPPPRIGA